MTPVPPPDKSSVRVNLAYDITGEGISGNRFFLTFTGSRPSAANCVTLAGDINAAWGTHIAPLCNSSNALEEVDVLDITDEFGASGINSTVTDGSRSGAGLPVQVCTNVEFEIARRYRGGKPRIFLPGPVVGDELDAGHWDPTFITAANAGVAAFFSEIEALSVGSMGTLQHVNLSYYKGFHNITNSSGRERAVPTYRDTALSDPVTGYKTSAVMGSQRRRRTSTTP